MVSFQDFSTARQFPPAQKEQVEKEVVAKNLREAKEKLAGGKPDPQLQSQIDFLTNEFEQKAKSIEGVTQTVINKLANTQKRVRALETQIVDNIGRLEKIKDELSLVGRVKVGVGKGQKAEAMKGMQKLILRSQTELNTQKAVSKTLQHQLTVLRKMQRETTPHEVAKRSAERFAKWDNNNPLKGGYIAFSKLNDCLKLIKALERNLQTAGPEARSEVERNLQLQIVQKAKIESDLVQILQDLQECKKRLGTFPEGENALKEMAFLEQCRQNQNFDPFIEKYRTPAELYQATELQNTKAFQNVKFGERPESETLMEQLAEASRHDPKNSGALQVCREVIQTTSEILANRYHPTAKAAVEAKIVSLQEQVKKLEFVGDITDITSFAFTSNAIKSRLLVALQTVKESLYTEAEHAEKVKLASDLVIISLRSGTKPNVQPILDELRVFKNRGDKSADGTAQTLTTSMRKLETIVQRFSSLLENKENLAPNDLAQKLKALSEEAKAIDVGKVFPAKAETPGTWTYSGIMVAAAICQTIDQAIK